MLRYGIVVTAILLLLSCGRRQPPPNKFSDEVFVRIAEYQDRRLADSLIQFFDHDVAAYRMAAALAFGSVQDTLAVDALGKLLYDSDSTVRSATAFALGQTTSSKAFQILSEANEPNPEVFEALGKSATKGQAKAIIESPWALYRLALRGFADSLHVEKADQFLQTSNANTRLGAAHFFSRGPANITIAEKTLIRCATSDSSVYVRMAATSALRKIKTDNVKAALEDILNDDPDYRVRISAVRALQAFPFDETIESIFKSFSDDNINVAIAASEVIIQMATSEHYDTLVEQAKTINHWRVKANLYEAALATTSRKELAEEIMRACTSAESPYEKAALISTLRHSPMSYSFVCEQHLSSKIPVIRSSSVTALTGMNKHRLFEKSMQGAFLECYQRALQGDDPAVIGTVASVLMDPALGYKSLISDYQFLYDARNKLSLPKDNEALQSLEQAIAYFEGKDPRVEVKNEYNHPIDWTFVKAIPRDQHATIKTEKGDIIIQLLVEEAPGSVANFLQLASSGYFNGKNFHRVVPNFVIQGGCNRGDGWGSEDYSIRSEFSRRRYKEGSVGMASAGKDTEGTQWFITHSPTPHLDGRYTIFAEVVKGMETVHRIEVGDKIISVEVRK